MPRKGINAVISIAILFIVIIIAIVASSYLFVSNQNETHETGTGSLEYTGNSRTGNDFQITLQNTGTGRISLSNMAQKVILPRNTTDYYQTAFNFVSPLEEVSGGVSTDLVTADGDTLSYTPLYTPGEERWTKSGASGYSVKLRPDDILETRTTDGNVLPVGTYSGNGYIACSYFNFPSLPADDTFHDIMHLLDSKDMAYAKLGMKGTGDLEFSFDARDGSGMRSSTFRASIKAMEWHFICMSLKAPEDCSSGQKLTQEVIVDGNVVGTQTQSCQGTPKFDDGVRIKITAPVTMYVDHVMTAFSENPSGVFPEGSTKYCAQVIDGNADMGGVKLQIREFERTEKIYCQADSDCGVDGYCDSLSGTNRTCSYIKANTMVCMDTRADMIAAGQNMVLELVGGCKDGCMVAAITPEKKIDITLK